MRVAVENCDMRTVWLVGTMGLKEDHFHTSICYSKELKDRQLKTWKEAGIPYQYFEIEMQLPVKPKADYTPF